MRRIARHGGTTPVRRPAAREAPSRRPGGGQAAAETMKPCAGAKTRGLRTIDRQPSDSWIKNVRASGGKPARGPVARRRPHTMAQRRPRPHSLARAQRLVTCGRRSTAHRFLYKECPCERRQTRKRAGGEKAAPEDDAGRPTATSAVTNGDLGGEQRRSRRWRLRPRRGTTAAPAVAKSHVGDEWCDLDGGTASPPPRRGTMRRGGMRPRQWRGMTRAATRGSSGNGNGEPDGGTASPPPQRGTTRRREMRPRLRRGTTRAATGNPGDQNARRLAVRHHPHCHAG